VRKKRRGEGNKEKGKREKEKGEKKKKYERVIWTSYTSIQEVKPFCQTFSKTTPAPSEKPLHQRSWSRSRFWRSRSPAKQALSMSDRSYSHSIRLVYQPPVVVFFSRNKPN
jgi:hypothetical protein